MAHFSPVNRRLINKQNSKSLQRQPRMTCIISARCSNGVVFVADRKIVNEYTRDVEYRAKLYPYYYPIVVGSSGDVDPFDSFQREALDAAQKIKPEISPPLATYNYQISGIIHVMPTELFQDSTHESVLNLHPYLEKLAGIITKYRKRYRTNFDVLFAAQTQERGAVLQYIDQEGFPSDILNRYKIIGSGEIVANALLKPLWHKDLPMEQFAEVAYFIIKYFDKFEIDYKVGLGGMKPQVWFIPDNLKQAVKEADSETLDNYEINTDQMLENFTKYGLKLLMNHSS